MSQFISFYSINGVVYDLAFSCVFNHLHSSAIILRWCRLRQSWWMGCQSTSSNHEPHEKTILILCYSSHIRTCQVSQNCLSFNKIVETQRLIAHLAVMTMRPVYNESNLFRDTIRKLMAGMILVIIFLLVKTGKCMKVVVGIVKRHIHQVGMQIRSVRIRLFLTDRYDDCEFDTQESASLEISHEIHQIKRL